MTASSIVPTGRAIADATPYPWPYHGHFHPPKSALVACLDPRWRRGGPGADRADTNLGALATLMREAGGLLVAVTETPVRRPLTHACQFAGGRTSQPLDPHVTIMAGATNAFYASRLDDVLRQAGCEDLVVAGWGLEGPVHSTLRAANDRGYECLLVSDASIPLEATLAAPACSMVQFSGGIFGAWATTPQVLELLGPGQRQTHV